MRNKVERELPLYLILGIWLLAQLAAAKVVATALCKGSGLVGGLHAPSLMIGAAMGAVFGGSAVELINSAMPGNASVAQPQAYALVGMAATLASVCSVPLTSVLLLFELTKDYRILLPLMVNTCLVSSICTRGISYRGRERGLLTCYPDTDLAIAKKLMEARGIKQLPVVKRGGEFQRERKPELLPFSIMMQSGTVSGNHYFLLMVI
ncbi:Chloride channel protein CLC-f [Camellia lanceoleosa]|uniref:Chloride channel protein CLC-f n=1 Tax=Camellia lanceoleosa TaxID=1840588 RepID=A0ACC0HE40_9ERIC|nr:Chloride channel protein CLC-f [Camellia lanceoleosa]